MRAKAVASKLLEAAEDHGLDADLSRSVGIELGLPADDLESLECGALLHDLGKAYVPEAILRKAGPLTPAESKIVEAHPRRGALLLEPWPCLGPAARTVEHHHERYDGGGYPEGLAEEQIPLGARIVCAVDAYDAMVRGRPYEHPRPPTEAIGRLFAEAGAQFDARVVAAVARVVV